MAGWGGGRESGLSTDVRKQARSHLGKTMNQSARVEDTLRKQQKVRHRVWVPIWL